MKQERNPASFDAVSFQDCIGESFIDFSVPWNRFDYIAFFVSVMTGSMIVELKAGFQKFSYQLFLFHPSSLKGYYTPFILITHNNMRIKYVS